MLSETEARHRILEVLAPLPAVEVSPLEALGRYLAQDERATVSLPAFDNSAMDGYALAFEGEVAATGAGFDVVGEQAAGHDLGLALRAGEALRVFTGAPVPLSTAAVAMQEEVKRAGDRITLREPAPRGEFLRRAGADVCAGQMLFPRGSVITAQAVGLFAAQGRTTLRVGGTPKVAVLATGDELISPGEPLRPGQIYESNSAMLAAQLARDGLRATILPRARDERAALADAIRKALAEHEVLVLSGGVSVGGRDFVKDALADCGVATDFWRVAIKPGKPFLFGRAPGGALVFGLPGNPVSSFVTFELLVRPALRALQGAASPGPQLEELRCSEPLANRDARPHWLRGRIRNGSFTPCGRQESHALFGLAQGNALGLLGGATALPNGALLPVLRL